MQQSAAPLKATRVPTRTKQLADLHVWAHKAGYSTAGKEGDPRREQYEAFLTRTIGLTSTRQASREQRERVIDELRRSVDAAYRLTNARPVEAVSDDIAAGVLD